MNYYVACALAGFLVGSLPWGLWMGRLLLKKDLRALGSGNTGATNVFRTMGAAAGVLVFLLDAGKGYVATAIFPGLLPGSEAFPYLKLVAGLAAVVGHVFTPFASFKGGKGVATSAGVFFGLAPIAAGVSIGIWALFVVLSGFVSLASMIAAFVLPFAIYLTRASVRNQWEAVFILAFLLAVVIWIRHRANLKRLINGTEARFYRKGKSE